MPFVNRLMNLKRYLLLLKGDEPIQSQRTNEQKDDAKQLKESGIFFLLCIKRRHILIQRSDN